MKTSGSVAGLFALAVIAVGARPVVAGPDEGFGERPVVIPGGVADPQGRTCFVAGPQGEVAAVRLSRGEEVARWPRLVWPLHATATRLAALGHDNDETAFRLFLADTKTHALVARSEPLPFPEETVPGSPGFPFSSLMVRSKDHHMILGWRLAPAGPSGVPTAYRGPARERVGGLDVDLEGGGVSPVAEESVQGLFSPAVPDAIRLGAPERFMPYRVGTLSRRSPLLVGDHWVALTLESAGGRETVRLRVWDRADDWSTSRTIPLLEGRFLTAMISPDHRTLFVYEGPSDTDLKGDRPGSLVGFSLETLERVTADLTFEPGTESAAVVGPRLLYTVALADRIPAENGWLIPLTLKASEASTGRRVWERPVAGRLVTPPRPMRGP